MALWSATNSWSAANCLGLRFLLSSSFSSARHSDLGGLLAALFLAYRVQPLSKGLHDMEPVDRYLGLGKVLGDAAKEGGRHVVGR